MNKEDLLWKVLRATTNSPNDIWKESHFIRHKDKSKDLLGDDVIRYTVPIRYIGNILGEEIYLVIQFSTNKLDYPYFVIGKDAFTKNLNAAKEFVYAFNVRLCKKSECKKRHRKIIINGAVKDECKKQIEANALGLVKNKPRARIMQSFLHDDFNKNMTIVDLENIILVTQFDDEERIYKGIVELKSDD